jgi:hypothetical protein
MNRIQQQSATVITAVPCREITMNKNKSKPIQSIQITQHNNHDTWKWHSMKITNIIKAVKHGTHPERKRITLNSKINASL